MKFPSEVLSILGVSRKEYFISTFFLLKRITGNQNLKHKTTLMIYVAGEDRKKCPYVGCLHIMTFYYTVLYKKKIHCIE